MPTVKVPAGAGLLSILSVVTGFAQISLNVSAQAVLLNSTEARTVKVSASKSDRLAYTVAEKPSWLSVTSSNNYTAPDTLYFQIANSNCGDCTGSVKLLPEGGGEAASIMVRYSPTSGPAQTRLIVSTASVNLSNTQARQVAVSVATGNAVEYTVTKPPEWLAMTSANRFTTPDTLYFQLVSSNCGACTAALTLLPAAGRIGTPLVVTYDVNRGSSYQATASHVTLAWPAAIGQACGTGFVSGCNIGISSTSTAVNTYNAKITRSEDAWILIDNMAGSVTDVPVANGLYLSANPAVVNSMATGAYSGQVVVYNPANQSDLFVIPVSLLVNPGSISISPASGAGSSQTFTLAVPHPGGWHNLSVVNMLIASTLDGQHACYAAYELVTGSLLLLDDQGKDYQAGSNSQCGVRLLSAKGDGNVLTIEVNVSFRAGFAGKKNLYLASRDHDQNNSGWQILGTWEVRPPAVAVPPRKKK
ncbi:exported hypothetical protein [Candidatus Sulfopaludibacter sp. SbA4]|nr:exported hypothetical protein [Candidatus Sulfopaludibacter sp. SbA4]